MNSLAARADLPGIQGLLRLARQHLHEGRLRSANSICKRILDAFPHNPEALRLLGVLKNYQREPQTTVQLNREAVAIDPTNIFSLLELGGVLAGRGKLDEAISVYRRVIAIKPTLAEVHFYLGTALQVQGQLDKATLSFQRALAINPEYAEAHHNLGILLHAQGKPNTAIECFQRALNLRPQYSEAHYNLGNVLKDVGQLDEAAASYRDSLTITPDYAEAHNNLGIVLHDKGELGKAANCFRRALRINHRLSEAHCNLGRVLQDTGTVNEATASYRRALAINPDYAEAHNNLGIVLCSTGRLDEAACSFRRSIAINPNFAQAHNNLGMVLGDLGMPEQAIASFRHAICVNPDYAEAHFGAALAYLLMGDFERGWPEYEWRWKCAGYNQLPFSQPGWDGTPLAGQTILVHAEQALGDTLQFIRYAHLVKQRGGTVVVMCQEQLVHLLAPCPGIDQLLPLRTPLPDFDTYAPLPSLPGIFKTSLATVPANVPYIFANTQLVERWRKTLENSHHFQIGITWQGNPQYREDRYRSIPLAHFAPLTELTGVRLFSLQKGFGAEQLTTFANCVRITDLGSQLDETSGAFMDTAAVMMNLDLVITSDTATAHLAGALGVPVWVLLPHNPDWRWLLNRPDSPWYPSMRLFRQSQMGNWNQVFNHITDELKSTVAGRD